MNLNYTNLKKCNVTKIKEGYLQEEENQSELLDISQDDIERKMYDSGMKVDEIKNLVNILKYKNLSDANDYVNLLNLDESKDILILVKNLKDQIYKVLIQEEEDLLENENKGIAIIPKATKTALVNKKFNNYVGDLDELQKKLLNEIKMLFPFNKVSISFKLLEKSTDIKSFSVDMEIDVSEEFNLINQIGKINNKLDEVVKESSKVKNVTSSNFKFSESNLINRLNKNIMEEDKQIVEDKKQNQIVTEEEETKNTLAGGLSLFAVLILIGMAIFIFLFFDNE